MKSRSHHATVPGRDLPAGAASPALLFLVLLVLIVGGGLAAWLVLRREPVAPPPKPAPPPVAAPETKVAEPAPVAEVKNDVPDVSDADWKEKMKGLQRIETIGRKGERSTVDTYPLTGDVVDAKTNEPVYFFWLYLIPPERGDVVEAAKSWQPNRFREGKFNLLNQPKGTYNVLCESREHQPWTGTINVPYDGKLVIRLNRGTAVEGVVRDVNQTPLEGIDVQLDVIKIDGDAKPPIQRLSKTDKMGHYSFFKLPAGEYSVRATLMSDELAKDDPFRLDANGAIVRDFTLPRLGTLKVAVSNVADQPLARARVTLVQERDGRERPVRTTYSDLKGIARVDFVREGSYKLRVNVQGFQPFEDSISVAAGEDFRDVPVRLQVAQKPGN